jgi:ribosome-binding protein aMBF1 (putative translation factor)
MSETVKARKQTNRKSKGRAGQRKASRATQEVARLRAQVARLRAEVRALKGPAAIVPELPTPNSDGNYPATETLRALLAQQIVRGREALGWTQAELAARAGVRQETISRLETGKHAPNVRTVDKIDRALRDGGA